MIIPAFYTSIKIANSSFSPACATDLHRFVPDLLTDWRIQGDENSFTFTIYDAFLVIIPRQSAGGAALFWK